MGSILHVHSIITVPILPKSINRFRNLRTVIVTADIHQGLYKPAIQPKSYHHPYLTFWHWSGVTPYTSSYEFAWSCVFGKQLAGNLSLRPPPLYFQSSWHPVSKIHRILSINFSCNFEKNLQHIVMCFIFFSSFR